MLERRLVSVEPASCFLSAVDLCFKAYYVLNLDFPIECKKIWNFIGNFVYNIVPFSDLTSKSIELKSYVEQALKSL